MATTLVLQFCLLVFVHILTATFAISEALTYHKESKNQQKFQLDSPTEPPFLAVWNTPVDRCSKEYGINIDFAKYNITISPNRNGWHGNNITLMGRELGLYPYIMNNGTLVNGGVPQNVDLQRHLTEAAKYIRSYLPDPMFPGLGVIDWEDWRPLYNQNWDSKTAYQNLSIKLVKQKHPEWNDSVVAMEAEKAFNIAAKNMMSSTVELAQQLRPHGKWGFYEFPRCHNYHAKNKTCRQSDQLPNNVISWLFKSSSALYPSCYLNAVDPLIEKSNWIYTQILEAYRVANYASKPELAVFPYTAYTYTNKPDLYSKEEMVLNFQVPAALGTNGMVLWGDNYNSNTRQACLTTKQYVETVIGPIAHQTVQQANECCRDICNQHGRCYIPEFKAVISSRLPYIRKFIKKYINNGQQLTVTMSRDNYACRCFTGWKGTHCETRM